MKESEAPVSDGRSDVTFRLAEPGDLPTIVALLADDFLGEQRESVTDPLPATYGAALDAILTDPNNEVLVACSADRLVSCLQITYTPSLSFQGSWRATLESVRTAADMRGRGIGAALVGHAVERARVRGCGMVQLSTNKARSDARRFYERLGFAATHEGMKLKLGE